MVNTSDPGRSRRGSALVFWLVFAIRLSSCTSTASEPASPPPVSKSESAPSTGVTTSPKPADAGCSADSAEGVDVPVALYGDSSSANLRFAGGAPPAARLCGTFEIESIAGRETGSANSTAGHLSYLFSRVQDGIVSSGGGYYWVAGSVDESVGTVVISFSEASQPITVTLAPLASGWRGFALLYSPGPGYYAPSSTEPHGPRNAGLTVTARD